MEEIRPWTPAELVEQCQGLWECKVCGHAPDGPICQEGHVRPEARWMASLEAERKRCLAILEGERGDLRRLKTLVSRAAKALGDALAAYSLQVEPVQKVWYALQTEAGFPDQQKTAQ